MANSDIRRRRQALMSAPPLLCLPRVDSRHAREELTSPLRREATDMIRREYLQSRQHEYEPNSRKREEFERLRKSIKTRYCPQQTHRNKQRNALNETEWRREITKVNIPDRLPITVPLRINSARPVTCLVDPYNSKNPMFYRTYTAKKSGEHVKHKLQYFINKDWSSERLSWINFNKNVPEFNRVSWVC